MHFQRAYLVCAKQGNPFKNETKYKCKRKREMENQADLVLTQEYYLPTDHKANILK